MSKLLKKITKSLSNYKLLSLIMFVMAAVCILIDAATFTFYQLSGSTPVINTDRKGQLTNALANQPVLGMVFFLLILIGLLIAIFCGYRSFQFIKAKDKVQPNKLVPWLMVASGALHLATIPFFCMIIAENGRTQIGIIATFVYTIIYGIACLLLIYPALTCKFYMPELNKSLTETEKNEYALKAFIFGLCAVVGLCGLPTPIVSFVFGGLAISNCVNGPADIGDAKYRAFRKWAKPLAVIGIILAFLAFCGFIAFIIIRANNNVAK